MPPPPSGRRRFHTSSKKNKKVPETADDFLDAGIEYEESGDRWKPGDKQKALRFYNRAIEAYQSAIRLNPRSFDATYNKARLEYKVSQEREFVPRGELLGLLETALQSHRECMRLDPQNEDALFNTAQVHSSLADALLNSRDGDPTTLKPAAIEHLCTACEIFSKCLEKQEALFASYSQPPPAIDETMEQDQETGGVSLPGQPSDDTMADAEDEQYAVIQEPVTLSTILDTLIELLTTLSTLLPLLTSPSATIATAESLLSDRLQALIPSLPERQTEIFITAAVLRCAIAESLFRSTSDVAKWEEAIAQAFGTDWKWQESADALCAKSDAHASLASAVAEPALAWKHYAFSSQALGNAASLEPQKAKIYLARGDTELIRSRIECPQRTGQVRDVLRKNAGVFYRGAARLAQHKEADVKREAEVKEAVVRWENGDRGVLDPRDAIARDIVQEACDDEIFGAGIWERIVEASS
ncbi:hypothetical protein FN846DRAFT_982211 [Sphaerosporella brunnea]|uniref:TPR-like protein n=1 Tax=Sphaerosporella brunnea TaxID=1250544 RepID=A0A5J5EDF7_9PEZI|nr:hypothetical protein FN846DRAFT_982211 [Sphaerosporella brunnea]